VDEHVCDLVGLDVAKEDRAAMGGLYTKVPHHVCAIP